MVITEILKKEVGDLEALLKYKYVEDFLEFPKELGLMTYSGGVAE